MRFLILTTVLFSGIAQGAADKPVVIPKGETVTGLCVGVHAGDSMTLLIATPEGKRQSKIRMDAIDAPELGQPFSNRSKKTLSDMVFDKQCTVESLGPDRYSRTIGRVSVAGRDRRPGYRERWSCQPTVAALFAHRWVTSCQQSQEPNGKQQYRHDDLPCRTTTTPG